MAMYVSLVQFTDQGIRNIKDTIKRSEAAMVEAEKMGMKIIQPLWTRLRCSGAARGTQRRDHECFHA
jgi:uncharacterized protein with GYD domain